MVLAVSVALTKKKRIWEMEKTTRVLLIVLLLIFGVVMVRCTSPQKPHSTPVTKEVPDTTKKMYLKSGRIIECDTVWEGMGNDICCRKSGNIIAYSAGEVDLIRTFGESSATEIAKRYEERKVIAKKPKISPIASQEKKIVSEKKETPKKASKSKEEITFYQTLIDTKKSKKRVYFFAENQQ